MGPENLQLDLLMGVGPIFSALVLCVLVEFLSPMTAYRLRDRFPGAIFVIAMPAFNTVMAPGLQSLWRTFGVPPLFDLAPLPAALQLVGLLIVTDFLNYWEHRFEHRFLWPVHAVHHSSEEVHAASNFGHPLQAFSEFICMTIPLSLIGFSNVTLPMAARIAVSFQSMMIHSPTRVHLGPLRRVLVDSRLHRIHHSRERRHYERNFGTIFSLWDQLFRTVYFPGQGEWPATGVEGLTPPTSLRSYLLKPIEVLRRHG